MTINKVDTEKAYQILWEKITSLELTPGAPLDMTALSDELGMSHASIQAALGLLVHATPS